MDEIKELKKRIDDAVQRSLQTEQLVYHLEGRLTKLEARIRKGEQHEYNQFWDG